MIVIVIMVVERLRAVAKMGDRHMLGGMYMQVRWHRLSIVNVVVEIVTCGSFQEHLIETQAVSGLIEHKWGE